MPEREYTEQEKEDLKVMRSLEELLTSKGWPTYIQLLNAKKLEWHNRIMSPVEDIGGLFVEEYAKGAVYGLTQATDLPSIIIEGVKRTVLPPKDESDV